MTAALAPGPSLALSDASRIVREALKDKSYRSTPLGLEVARYIRWKRSEWGAQPDTIRDYEPILARLALFFADLGIRDFEAPVGTERLRECWDYHWGDRTGRTRAKVRSVWVDFFDWAVRERRGIVGNPARALASPKRRGVKREPFEGNLVDRVLTRQDYPADRLGCILVLKYGVRRAELGGIRIRDFNLERRQITVSGKGGKVRIIPIVERAFWRDLGTVELDLGGREQALDFFLIHRRYRRGMVTTYQPWLGYVPKSIHTWWYNRLEAAGLVGSRDDGSRKGLGMHRGRHTVATEILRGSGNIVAASKLLGHAHVSTTEESYAAFDTADLARVLSDIREEHDEDGV